MATPIVSQSVYSPVVPAGSPAKPHASVYEIITSQILAKLERGAVPWRKPWHSLPPANLITKRPYRGINVFLLGFAGYGSQYALFFTVTSIALMFAQSSSLRVYSDTQHNVHVTSANGKNTTVASEAAQVGIDAIKVADDKQTAGWLALYKDPDGGSPVAGRLVLWRGGRIMRSFPTDQTFWSWAFEHNAEQVSYHVGPKHGETASHCELHDLRTGRLLASWDGDLEGSKRPAWTNKLDH